jgi:hypothetical protein
MMPCTFHLCPSLGFVPVEPKHGLTSAQGRCGVVVPVYGGGKCTLFASPSPRYSGSQRGREMCFKDGSGVGGWRFESIGRNALACGANSARGTGGMVLFDVEASTRGFPRG